MGKNRDTLTVKNLEIYLNNVTTSLQRLQPELNAQIVEGAICITGNLICSGNDGAFDTFEIAAFLPIGFPYVEPFVWETGDRIPRIADRHVYPKPGNCCLCVWQEWLWETQNLDFEAFLTGPLHSYFVSQSIFEMTGEWPFGERSHDKDGLDQALVRMLGIIPNVNTNVALRILSQPRIKGHTACACGSGKRLRHCHMEEFHILQTQLPAACWKQVYLQFRTFGSL